MSTPPPPSELEFRAAQAQQRGEVEDAFNLYSEAVAANPASYIALAGVARCHGLKGRSGLFELYAGRAMGALPRDIVAYNRLGNLFVEGAQLFSDRPCGRRFAQIGIEYLRQVFAGAPETPSLAYHLGLAQLTLKDYPAAGLFFEKAMAEEPGRQDVMHAMLLMCRAAGDKPRARSVLARAADHGPIPAAWRSLVTWAGD